MTLAVFGAGGRSAAPSSNEPAAPLAGSTMRGAIFVTRRPSRARWRPPACLL